MELKEIEKEFTTEYIGIHDYNKWALDYEVNYAIWTKFSYG
jgi:hypothetical protein